MSDPAERYAAAVSAWTRHLRGGGATPWHVFWPTVPPDAPASTDLDLPGAAQLALLRRLETRAGGPGEAVELLADRVLARDGPGRGSGRIRLAHPDAAGLAGPPPLDPEDVPATELTRLAVGVLTDLVEERVEGYVGDSRRRGPWRLPRRLRRGRIPRSAGAALGRHALAAASARSLPRGAVVVCAPTLDQLLTEAWSARVQLGSGVRWRRFVATWSARDALPRSADVAARAAELAAQVGPRQVHVFLGAGARRLADAPLPAPFLALSTEGVDVLRRINPLLGMRLPVERRPPGRALAAEWLRGGEPAALAVPAGQRAWARRRAQRIAEALSAGGYAVHGRLEEFTAGADAPRGPRIDAVLERVLDALVTAQHRTRSDR